MINYLLHSSLLIMGFYVCYQWLLSKETFFTANRWVLLMGILLSFVLPFVSIPESWSINHAFDKSASLIQSDRVSSTYQSISYNATTGTQHSKIIDCEVSYMDADEMLITEESIYADSAFSTAFANVDWIAVGLRIYFLGLLFFVILFLIQLGRIAYFIWTGHIKKIGTHRLIEHPRLSTSFSFANMIFIQSHCYDQMTYNQILDHEAVHIKDRHSYDMLIAELLLILQWYNPFAWMYKKAVENNLEFITDHQMIHRGIDAQQYQMSLVRVAIPLHTLSLVNNYNQSFLKKRIIMMNAQKSSLRNSWKYLILFPMVGLSMSCLNNVNAQNEPPAPPAPPTPVVAPMAPSPPEAPTSPSKTNKVGQPPAPPQPPAPIAPPVPPRIHAVPKAPKPMMHFNGGDEVDVTKGKWHAENDGDKVCFELEAGKSNHQWQWSECWKKSQFGDLSKLATGPIIITRDAGTITLSGKYLNGEASGDFNFSPSSSFKNAVKNADKEEISDAIMMHLFISDFSNEYLNYLVGSGLRLTDGGIVALAIHEVSMAECKNYISQLKNIGLNTTDVEDIVKFKIHDVDVNYIKDLKSAGITDLSVENIMMLSIHDVDVDYLRELDKAGLKNLSTEEIAQFAIHGIDVDNIKSFIESGLKDLSTEDIIQFAIHDIDADYLKSFERSDIQKLTKDELIRFAIHDVEPRYILDLRRLGFKNISNEDIIECHIHDVNPAEMQAVIDLGFKNASIRDFIDLSIHGISARDIKKMIDTGHKNKSLTEYRDMIISNQY